MATPPRQSHVPAQTETWSGIRNQDETAAQPASDAPAAPGFGPPAEPGEVGRLGPYRVVKELGRGGMGAVYAALDTRLDRRLALKVMLPQYAADPVAKERFLREARAAAKISHDNVVTVYEADERQGVPYIAMQFLEGYPLDQYLQKKGTPTIPQVLRIAAEAAAGLAAAHKIGLVHRDIKPGNLWLEAPNGRVKVLDFGLAKPVDAEAELTRSGAVVGTPAYMSPEQARGEKVDHRTDLFSLGSVLYRLCAGRLPFSGPTTMAVLMALGTEEPPPVGTLNPDVPASLAALIHQLLSKNADARPQSAAEVVKRVRAIAEERAVPRALPVEQSTSQPQVMQPQAVYAVMSVTAPAANPFADLDSPATEVASREVAAPAAESARPKPTRAKPTGKGPWVLAGLAGLLALVIAGGVIIVIKNKDGTETKIEVPDGATVTVKGKDGKTLAQVKPGGAKPALDPDRKAAEYALSVGGVVQVDGQNRDLRAAADLPKDRFTLTVLVLSGCAQVTDAGLAHFKECKGLTHLELGYTQVTDAGLAHFKECKGLTQLHLGSTRVTDAGLAHFKECKGLTVLVLWNCTQVTDAGLAHFKECKGLTVLSLGGTQVTDAGLAHFKECKGLTHLNLGYTQVTDAGLAHFKECKGLTQLHLGGTRVTDAGLAHFKECKGLTDLNLHNTQVTDAGLAHFKEYKGLTSLGLPGTQVTDAGLAHLKECKGLTVLSLGGTRVTDAGLAHFKECKGLTDLNLHNTQVTDAGLAHFKEYKGLTYLSLGGTQVTDAGLAHFKECKGLTHLSLGGTQVTDAGLAHLKECKGLTHLEVRNTQVTAKGLAEFHAAVPGCRIEHDGGIIEPKK